MVRVSGLYRLGLRVPDLEAVADFYQKNWAMQLVRGDEEQRFFRSRGADHSELMLSKGEVAQLDHLALSVKSEADLAVLLANIERAGFAVSQPPTGGTRPGESLVAAVNDLDGNRIELVVPSCEELGDDAPFDSPARHLGHVVLWTPRVEAQEAFYALLGFQVSDRSHIGMSFLRCNTDHHSIALARNSSGRTGLQHAAFDVGSLDEVMREFARLRSEGVACIWGVGRHGPGNNVFAYYRDPAGNVVEYYGDMETVAEAESIEPRFWGAQHKGDIWGVAGAAPAIFRD